MLLCLAWSLNLKAQSGVLNPADPDVVFTTTNRPAAPSWGVISKWGHTNRLTWNSKRPFDYGFKSYYYKGMAFRLKFPKTYQHNVNDGKKYPVFIFLHGLGERGDIYDNEYQLLHGGQTHAQNVDNGNFDGFLLYTQSQNGFHNSYFPAISDLIDSLVKYVKADIDRVILSGLSSGGQSTWDFMADYYKDFCAALPISAAQDEDMPSFSRFVTVPIWTGNGGLDINPTPEGVTTVVNYFRSLGGNIRQTFYPTDGHGVWDKFWSQSDYFPTLNTYHKANPLVYFGRTEFCPNDAVSVHLGLMPGFSAYEWQKSTNGTTWTTISGATSADYTATQYGYYRARFKRTSTSAWSEWSPTPIQIQQKAATVTPPIQIDGLRSKVLPAPDGSTTTPLTVSGNFVAYEWRRVSDNALVGSAAVYNAPAGQYKVQVTEQYGCSSSFSDPFTVISASGAGRPDNPSNLSAAALSNSAIQLDWNDNPNPANNETGFEIYRSSTHNGPYTLIAITAADVLTYSDNGLNPNTSYFYIIRAVNNNGASDVTSEATAKTQSDTQAPTAPEDLTVTGSNRYSVSLSWSPSNDDVGVVKYDVYVNGQKAYSTSETNFTVYNLTQGQSYTFAVKARDLTGNLSPFSNQVTGSALLNGLNYKYYTFTGTWNNLPNFTTLTPLYTGSSANVDITPRNQEDNFAFLWEGYINIPTTGTYYFRTNSDDGSRLWLGALNGTTSPYSFSGTPTVNNDGLHGTQDRTSSAMTLTAGTYPIAIAFYEQSGGQSITVSWRTPSTGTSFVTIPNSAFQDAQPVLIPPAAPSNLVVTAGSYDRINLSWTDNSNNESGFEIWRSTSQSDGFITVGTAPANATSFVDSLLAPATTYYYKLRTIGQTGQSTFMPAYNADAIWKFNNDYTDASGNGRTLTANNTPTFSSSDKKEGTHSVDLDGSSEDLTVNSAAGDYLRGGYSAKTVAFWMRSDVSNSNRGIFDFGGSDDGLAMRLNSNQIIAGVASNNIRSSISASYSSTAWNHIALVYSGNTLRMYVNGTQVASNTSLAFSSIGTTSDASMIGDDNGSDALNTAFGQFDGRFDDFWILNTALSASEITQLMNGTYVFKAFATTQPLPSAPAAASLLAGSALSTSSIQLTWNDNSNNETGFEIWRSVGNNTTYRLVATTDANATSYTDQGLFANVTYYYKVRAKGVGGNSAYSNEVNVPTGNNSPVLQPVSDFTMRFDSQRTLNLSASDADGENISLSFETPLAFATFTNNGNGTGQLVFNPNSSQQGVYNLRVIATDQHSGKDTADFVLTVNSNYVPVITPVNNVSINENAQSTINLSASDQDGNAGLQWQTTGLPAFVTLTPGANGAATLALAPNFAQAGVYPVTLSVADGSGGVGTYAFTITVNNVEPSTNKWYVNIQYNDLPGGSAPWNNVNGLSANNLKDQNNVSTPVGLQFMTTAWNAFNGGAQTGNNSGVYPDNVLRDYYYFGIFGAPETVDFRVTNLDPAYKYNITLMAGSSWTGVPDNGSTVFTINGNAQSLYTQNNTQNTVTFTSLTPDASGNITVNMSKAAGSPVGYLNAFVLEKVFDDGTTPVLPTDLQVQNNGGGSAKLTWTDVAYNELRYDVYRSTSLNGVYTLLNPAATNNNTTQYIDNTVQGLTTYYYKIAAVNNYGSSGLTNAVSLTTLNKAPVVGTVSDVYVKSGNSTSVNFTSSDDAGETLTASVTNLPAFASFVNNGSGNGSININPGASDLGIYKDVTITVTDNAGLSTQRKFDITVSDNATRSIYVNLAGEFGTPQGQPWNNFVSYPFAGWSVANLKDDQNVSTNYGFRLVDGWTQSWQGGMITGNNSGIHPDNVIKTSIYEGSTNTKRVQFTGLDVNKKYNIAVFSSNNAGFDASFTLATTGQSVVFNGRYNSTSTAQLNGLTPNASGVIEFSMTKSSGALYMFLNAVVLQEYGSITTTPVRPIELFTQINAPGKINLSWSDRSSNETGFEIWRSANGGAFSLLTTTAANVTAYTDNSAATNTRYFYKVRAANGAIFSDYSNTADAKLGNNTVYLNLNASTAQTSVPPQGNPWNNTNNTPQVGNGVTDMNNLLGNNTGYSMVLTNDWGGYFDLGMTGGILPDNVMLSSWWIEGNSRPGTFKLYNLDQSKRYRIGFMGSSSWDGDFTATYTINDRTVYLNSNKNNSKIVYIDNVQTNSDGEINVSMGFIQATRWSFLSAIIIESYDSDTYAAPPIVSQRIVRDITSQNLGEAKPNDIVGAEVKVFPNPFTGSLKVNISAQSSQNVSLKMFDITGKLIFSKNLGQITGSRTENLSSSQLGNLIPGTYILQVISDDENLKTIKLIKNK